MCNLQNHRSRARSHHAVGCSACVALHARRSCTVQLDVNCKNKGSKCFPTSWVVGLFSKAWGDSSTPAYGVVFGMHRDALRDEVNPLGRCSADKAHEANGAARFSAWWASPSARKVAKPNGTLDATRDTGNVDKQRRIACIALNLMSEAACSGRRTASGQDGAIFVGLQSVEARRPSHPAQANKAKASHAGSQTSAARCERVRLRSQSTGGSMPNLRRARPPRAAS